MSASNKPITSFRGAYSFLSNFYWASVYYEGIMYPTSEHAFQAAKTLEKALRLHIGSLATPAAAKAAGKRVLLRPNWENIKVGVMRDILREKFRDIELREKLLATEDAELIEENDWNDVFWGVCRGVGKNALGKCLMEIRAELQEEQFACTDCGENGFGTHSCPARFVNEG